MAAVRSLGNHRRPGTGEGFERKGAPLPSPTAPCKGASRLEAVSLTGSLSMLKRRPRCHGSDNAAHAPGRQRRGVGHVVVQEQSQHPPATEAVPRQHVPPQRHAQQQLPAPCTLRRPLSRRAKENICQEARVLPHLAPRTTVLCARGAGRALVMGCNYAAVDRHEGSSGGRSRHQTRHRWCPGIRIGHEQWPISRKMATNNGPFRSMA